MLPKQAGLRQCYTPNSSTPEYEWNQFYRLLSLPHPSSARQQIYKRSFFGVSPIFQQLVLP